MEIFGARPEGATQASLRDLEDSELFIGIYAHRYGYISTNSAVSITEQEYDKAKELKKPMFCFIVDPDYPWPPSMIEGEPGKSELLRFKKKIDVDYVRAVFTSPQDLAVKVATALGHYLTRGLVYEFSKVEGEGVPGDNYLLAELDQLGYPKTFDVLLRKSVRNLSAGELNSLRRAYSMMMAFGDEDGYRYNRGYRYLAGIHGIPDFKSKYGDFRVFLPWNRAYIYWFERYLQDASYDSSISVPWWDWRFESSKSDGIPKAFSDAIVDGQPNPLHHFHVVLPDEIDLKSFRHLTNCPKSQKYSTQRQPSSPSSLPTAREIEAILDLTDYADFSDQLEDYNNRVHCWVGGRCGDMSYIPFASYDPIFWSHRAMIDRIFWLWQTKPGNSLPANLSSEILDPFKLAVRDVLDIRRLGYDYGQQLSIEVL
jgi:tyrosinase